ncbi:MAG: putative lipid II flippase FtsW [Deltaproteobacteria bacterium]|nr:putative lipid II flippase FtsW [Deltaproteobacteria bacterium]MBW1952206.1 putative lipid II flippase FtsW [Deltaproteobacteria bacterium]MBW2133877.1 putative lipid II flippase FtsW [Deltaproteobacteria bacterium]
MADQAEPQARNQCDHVLLIVTLLLVSIGLVMVFSSSGVMAYDRYQDPYFFLRKQGIFAVLGLALMFLVRKFPYQIYYRLVYLIFLVSLTTLIMLMIPGLGVEIRGATRWLRIGPFLFQPSELAKLAIVIFLAYSMARKQEKMKYFAIGFIPHIIVAGVFIILIEKQPDFGTAMTITVIVFLLLFVGGTRLTHIFLSGLALVPIIVYAIVRDPKRLERVITFLKPFAYKQESGYQLVHSLYAIGSGGLGGLGIGKSQQKLFYLPDMHTDFILAIIAEEVGLIGVLVIICLFFIFVIRGISLSLKVQDNFGCYLALGLVTLIGLQAGLNMGVVSGILPTKGMSLPFISYGGSSLLVNLMAVGILLNISAQSQVASPGLESARARQRPRSRKTNK